MRARSSILLSVGWRVLVVLLVFNPAYSVSHWLAANWETAPGIALIVAAVVAVVFVYMLSLAKEFPGATLAMAVLLAALIGGAALQGWLDATSLGFWKWAAPICAGLLFSAGPLFSLIRQREAGVVGTDETPG